MVPWNDNDQCIPSDRVIDSLVCETVLPILRQFEERLCMPLPARFSVWVGERPSSWRFIGANADVGPTGSAQGEIRARFKPTFRPGGFRCYVESVFDNVDHKSAFSGFILRGLVTERDGRITVDPRGTTGKYGPPGWGEPP